MVKLGESVVSAGVGVLRDQGPMDSEQWLAAMVAAGLGSRSDLKVFSEGNDHDAVGRFVDGRVCALDTLLDERILTHRVTETEVRLGLIATFPDLTPMMRQGVFGDASGLEVLTRTGAKPATGDDARDAEEIGLVALRLPAEAQREMRAGEILGLRFRRGSVQIEDVSGSELAVLDLRGQLRVAIAPEQSVRLDGLIWQLMAEDPELLAVPSVPIGELLASAGHVTHINAVASQGFDFMAEFTRKVGVDWARRFDIDEDGVESIFAMRELLVLRESGAFEDRAELVGMIEGNGHRYLGLHDQRACQALLEVADELEHSLWGLCMVLGALFRVGPVEVRENTRWLMPLVADRIKDQRTRRGARCP